VRVATVVSSSTSSHNSSSSISDGFKRPPTFIALSRSSSFAFEAACSRSSAKSSALSPENSFSEMRKSRRMILNRLRSELVAKRPSMNDAICALWLVSKTRLEKQGKTYVCRLGNAVASKLPTKLRRNSRLGVPAGAISGDV
jgi:hypothetical protein